MMEFNQADRLLLERRAANVQLFAAFDPRDTIAAFDAIDEREPYHTLGPLIVEQWAGIQAHYGVAGFEAYQHVTMLTLMRDFESRARGCDYTPDILARFAYSYTRIIVAIQNRDFEHYRSQSDLLLKDMALCRQKMFPAGAQVVEPSSGFHRALLFRGGLGQFWGVVKLLLASGGNSHWYQIHTHLDEREEFTPDGWDLCYVRIARLMERHPTIRGMYGGSWFYDPALATVSPRLTYLRTRPEENGALVFYSNDDPHGGALATSETRRRLYDKGEYLPKAYALIWPREPMIAWARQFAVEHGL